MTRDPFFKGFCRFILKKGMDLVRAINIDMIENIDALKVKHWIIVTA